MGNTKSNKKIVFMLDFGLSRQYVNNEGQVRTVCISSMSLFLVLQITSAELEVFGRRMEVGTLFYV